MQHNLTTNQFWQFSLDYYSKSAHSEQLLLLQDTYDANINLCLLLKFLESQALTITSKDINSLHQSVTCFNAHHTRPLRALRKQFKKELNTITNYSALRQHLLNAELELEKQEQALLLDKVNQLPLRKGSSTSINIYLFEVLAVSKTDLDQILFQLS